MAKNRFLNARVLTLVTALVLLGGVAGFFIARRGAATGAVPAVADAGGYQDQPTLGDPDAPVKMILFENFLCGHCQAFEEDAFAQLKRDYIDTGKVEAYYVNLAWGNESAVTAGRAGECAFRQDADAFWRYRSALFAAQGADGWATLDRVLEVAEGVEGLEPERLRTCITEGETQGEVARDIELADYVGVTGTPSVIVGNQGFEAPSFEALRAEIDRQLAAAR